MKPASGLVATLLLLVPAVPATRADEKSPFFFHKGDRIVFLGDSITEQYQYSNDIELYLTTRFPKWDLTFINAGIGGDTATGGAARFAEHVLAENPTAVTIDFGMNDGGYSRLNPTAAANFIKKTEAMLEAAHKAGVRVALMSPNVVDWRVNKGLIVYRETQKQFYAPLKELAVKHQLPFVDQYAVTRAAIERMEQENATSVKPFPDAVHTGGGGGLLMAHTILAGLHAPAVVSRVDVDAPANTAKTKGCAVEKLEASNARVSFERTDEALPLPVQADWLSMLPYVNQLKDLNWYGLKVAGLNAGTYALHIDGKEVGSYTADELAHGVNLGNLTTGPIHDQGQKVFEAIDAKNKLVHQRFRGVVMYHIADWLADVGTARKAQELAKRMTQISERQAEIYKLAQPVTHRFELNAAK